jgi:beta-galactosidase
MGDLMEKSLKLNELTIGVCYYPEHWPEELWEDDLNRMKTYGIKVVRVAEFAWNKFEPAEGMYTYDLVGRDLSCPHDGSRECKQSAYVA